MLWVANVGVFQHGIIGFAISGNPEKSISGADASIIDLVYVNSTSDQA